MKNLGIILLCYNLACLSVLNTDWYDKYWTVIDSNDWYFYVIGAIVFFAQYKKLSKFQRDCFIFAFIYLGFKVLDYIYFFNYATFMFWNLFIIFFPLFMLIERNINYSRFKK